MKKTTYWSVAALLAAGALVFGTLGCDSGDKDYVKEIPTTYADNTMYDWLGDTSNNSKDVTAVWNFTDATVYPEGAVAAGTEIKPSAGKGAKLVSDGSDTSYGKDTKENHYLAVGYSSTTSLNALNKGGKGKLTLTLDGQTNVIIKVIGSGAAAAGRSIGIVRGDSALTEDLVVYKGGLSNASTDPAKATVLQLAGAPAGTYTIHVNGVRIYSISASSDADVTPIGEVQELKVTLKNNADESAAEEPIEVKLNEETAVYVFSDDGSDYTTGAVYTVREGADVVSVAEGKITGHSIGDEAVIRARVNRVYKDFKVKVVAGEDKIDVTSFIATPAKKFEKDVTLHVGSAKFSEKAQAALIKGASISGYLTVGSESTNIANLTGVVKTAATDSDVTVTISGTPGATEGDVTVTLTALAAALVKNNAGAAGDSIEKSLTVSVVNGTFVTLFAGSKLPDEYKEITLDSNDTADLTKLLDTTLIDGNHVKVGNVTLKVLEGLKDNMVSFAEKQDDALKLAPYIEAKNGLNNYKRGLSVKAKAKITSKDILSLSFDVTPADGKTIKLDSITPAEPESFFCGQSGSTKAGIEFTTKIGDTTLTEKLRATKGEADPHTVKFTSDNTISTKTTITLTLASDSNGGQSIAVQDLKLLFKPVE